MIIFTLIWILIRKIFGWMYTDQNLLLFSESGIIADMSMGSDECSEQAAPTGL